MATRHKMLGAAAAEALLEASFLDSAADTTDGPSYTFSGVTLGTSSGSHHVIVTLGGSGDGPPPVITGVTVDGQACSQVALQSSGRALSAIYITDAPITATTGSVVVSFGAGTLRMSIGTYEAVNLASTTAIDTGGAIDTIRFSDTLASVEGGFAVASVYTGVNSASSSWSVTSPLVEDYEFLPAAMENRNSAGASAVTSGATVAMEATQSNSATNTCYTYATFR